MEIWIVNPEIIFYKRKYNIRGVYKLFTACKASCHTLAPWQPCLLVNKVSTNSTAGFCAVESSFTVVSCS